MSAAIGIIFNDQKTKVLLVLRRDVPIWVLPGGGINPSEGPDEAVCREVWEETGIRVNIVKKSAEYFPINSLAQHTHLFECRPKDGCLRISCETTDVKFHSLNQLPKNFFIVHQEWLLESLSHMERSVKRPLDQVTYWNLCRFFLRSPLILLRYCVTKFCRS